MHHAARLAVAFVLLQAAPLAAAEIEINLPPDAGVLNVKADFGAKGDGRTDDTAAIREAIRHALGERRYAAPPFVYFPRGTYRVSDILWSRVAEEGWSAGWRAGMHLVGQSRQGTVLRLRDRCPGYADPTAPRAVLMTGSESDNRENAGGGGNRAFRHVVWNLTVDTGRGNPGAVAVDYVVSNRGAIENVTLRSGDGAGVCGLRLQRHWPGPGLIKHVRIEGFDHAVRVGHYQYSMTFEHVHLTGQRLAGIVCPRNVLAIRGLHSTNAVPVLQVAGGHGHVALLDAVLEGGAPDRAAIEGKGKLLLRNVTVRGYGTAVDDQTEADRDVPGGPGETRIGEYATEAHGLGAPAAGLRLPVEETPTFHAPDLGLWVGAGRFGATPDDPADDDADALQKAIDTGGPVVYLPAGVYHVGRTVIVRGPVRKITGLHSAIMPRKGTTVEPLVRVEGTGADAVVLEHLRLQGLVEHASARALALRHLDFRGYRNTPDGTGPLFLEDTIGKPIRILHPQPVWGRQVNSEFGDAPLIENHGGTLWLLGFKTEGHMVCIRTVGGRTELLGALLYPTRKPPATATAFVNEGGRVGLTYAWNGHAYPVHLRQTGTGADATFTQKDTTRRGPALLVGDASQ